MKPLVSIIIPVYNGSNYVKQAIESALNQTYKDIEVIVVNDGSRDDGKTAEACNPYLSKIQYFEKANGGVASAINYGIRQMKGEYFAWLSHDDLFKEDKIEKQMNSVLKSEDKNCVCFSNFEFFNDESKERNLFDIKNYCDETKIEEGLYPILFGLIHFCTVLVSKKRIDEVGLCDESLRTTQDIEWLFRLLRSKKNIFIEEPLTLVRLHEEQGKRTIKEYNEEQSAAHISFMERVSEAEMIALFGSKRNYYWQMTSFYRKDNNRIAFEYAREKYIITEKSPKDEEMLEKVKERIDAMKNGKHLVIFCTGQYGRKLLFDLQSKDISVDCLSDNNSEKWGEQMSGVEIVSPDKLDKGDCLVVAKNNPEEVIDDLRKRGFFNVNSYIELEKITEAVLPTGIPNWEEF